MVTVDVGLLLICASGILSAGICIGAQVVERADETIERQMEEDRKRARRRAPRKRP